MEQTAIPQVIRYGTHGTTRCRAQDILSHGFKESETGRKGPGVYLWQYVTKPETARELAYYWWQSETNRNRYKEALDPRCSILSVTVHTLPTKVLDLRTPEFREEVRDCANRLLAENEGLSPEIAVSQACAKLVVDIESDLSQTFSVLETTASAPRKVKDPLLPFIGEPDILVVREASCISNIHKEDVDHELKP